MGTELAGLLELCRDEIIADAASRLSRAPANAQAATEEDARLCTLALQLAVAEHRAERLAEAAIEMARSERCRGRGYRRAQLTLDAVATAAVAALRRHLPKHDYRVQQRELWSLLGPAQVSLAAVCRETEPVPAAVALG